MPITSPVVLGIIAALAVLIPVLLVITWRRRPRGVGGALLRLVAILCCQVLALTAGILAANRTYDFYSSWGDLFGSLGQQGGDDDDQSGLPSSGSDGRVVLRTVRAAGAGPGAPRLEVRV